MPIKLTPAEKRVFDLLRTTLHYKEIAARLSDISYYTVRFHVRNIYKKLGVSGEGPHHGRLLLIRKFGWK